MDKSPRSKVYHQDRQSSNKAHIHQQQINTTSLHRTSSPSPQPIRLRDRTQARRIAADYFLRHPVKATKDTFLEVRTSIEAECYINFLVTEKFTRLATIEEIRLPTKTDQEIQQLSFLKTGRDLQTKTLSNYRAIFHELNSTKDQPKTSAGRIKPYCTINS